MLFPAKRCPSRMPAFSAPDRATTRTLTDATPHAGRPVPHRRNRSARGARARARRAVRRRPVRPADRSGRQAPRRRDGADAGLQRLDPGPDAEGAGGLGGRRQRRQRGRPGGHRALARPARSRTATTARTRRRSRSRSASSFTSRVAFPDPGVYWYHPHIREDYGQEMGLYGNVLVEPADPDYWPPVHREVVLTLDDILLEDGKIAPFSRTETTLRRDGPLRRRAAGRGEPDLSLTAQRGEVVRLYLTNTANTRVFKVALPGARMKLVGGDSGHVEHEQFVDEVVLAPSERVVVDVLFDQAGELDAGAPHAGSGLSAGRDHRQRGAGRAVAGASSSRSCARNADMAAERRAHRAVPGRRARQDACLHRRDGHGCPEETGRSSTPARCTPRSSASSRATALSAA